MPKFLDLLLGGNKGILDTVKETVDEFTLSKEEKAELEQRAKEQEQRDKTLDYEQLNKELNFIKEIQQQEIENTKSARETEVAVLNAPKSNWLTVNIRPLLGIGTIFLTFILFYILIFRKNLVTGVTENILYTVLGAVIGYSGTIYNYYFGSSSSSNEKTEIIKELKK